MIKYLLVLFFFIIKPLLYLYLVIFKFYRYDIVLQNLSIGFPNISLEEKQKIANQFFKNFLHYIQETLQLVFISQRKLEKKISVVENTAFNNLKSEKHGAIVLTAHFFNWEYAGIIVGIKIEQPMQVVYKTLSNSFFDKLLIRIRTRFGNRATTMENTARSMINGVDENLVTCFLADQTPMINPKTPFREFLNKNVPFFDGYSKIAAKLDLPIYYGDIEKNNNQYIVTFTQIDKKEDIVNEYITLLESSIKKHPETWLWTHRRFKRAK